MLAIVCTSSFLDPAELALAIAFCWEWSDAGDKEKSRGLHLRLTQDILIHMCDSRSAPQTRRWPDSPGT